MNTSSFVGPYLISERLLIVRGCLLQCYILTNTGLDPSRMDAGMISLVRGMVPSLEAICGELGRASP